MKEYYKILSISVLTADQWKTSFSSSGSLQIGDCRVSDIDTAKWPGESQNNFQTLEEAENFISEHTELFMNKTLTVVKLYDLKVL